MPLAPAYAAFLAAFGCPILPMRYESAELAKIAINCCLVASISVANTLAELCERIGADWSEIVPALKLDKRIGQHAYLSARPRHRRRQPRARPCDGDPLRRRARDRCGRRQAWVANSRHRRDWAARTIRKVLLDGRPDAIVAVWGLAYKENTHSIKNSPSLATVAQLPDTSLRLHDPVVPASAARHERAVAAVDALDAVKGADALMILTPWPEYRQVDPARIAAAMRGHTVLDPYAVLEPHAAVAAGLELHTLGRGPMKAGNA